MCVTRPGGTIVAAGECMARDHNYVTGVQLSREKVPNSCVIVLFPLLKLEWNIRMMPIMNSGRLCEKIRDVGRDKKFARVR